MPSPEIVAGIAYKFIGAVSGTVLALVFIPPVGRSEFYRRAVAGVLSGLIFAPVPLWWLGFPVDIEGIIAGGCATAFAGWWIMGMFIRLSRTYRRD